MASVARVVLQEHGMAARRSAKHPAAPAAPVAPPRERFRPPWLHNGWSSVSHNLHEAADWVGFVRRGRLRLPRFQRGWTWTDAQIVSVVESILRGYHIGQLLLWEQHRMPASVQRFGEFEVTCAEGPAWLVVDGQQRLGAICTAACSGRFWVDTMAGQLVTEPGPWRMPASWFLDVGEETGISAIVDHHQEHAARYGLPGDDVRDAAALTRQVVERAYIGAVRFGPDWDIARVMESYRRQATCGTPMDAAEVEDGLRRETLDQGA